MASDSPGTEVPGYSHCVPNGTLPISGGAMRHWRDTAEINISCWAPRGTRLAPNIVMRIKQMLLARIIHEGSYRARAADRDHGRPQGFGSEAWLNTTSQGPKPEDARQIGLIHARGRSFMNNAGWRDLTMVHRITWHASES